MILLGDCIERMAEMDEASVDAIVTDPPYGLEFMGKEWDSFKQGRAARYQRGGELITSEQIEERRGKGGAGPSYVNRPAKRCRKCGKQSWSGSPCKCEQPEWELDNSPLHAAQAWHQAWAIEALRVLRPGGHLLAFGGTRTYHRLACAVEDAGFEIRDSLIWLYGSGFPKSHNLNGDWQGWGTALKPAHEPIVVARKPLIGTVAQNVLEHGTGAINVDGCRIGTPADKRAAGTRRYKAGRLAGGLNGEGELHDAPHDGLGRWPANVALSHLPPSTCSECGGNGERDLWNDGPKAGVSCETCGGTGHIGGCEQIGTTEVKGNPPPRFQGADTLYDHAHGDRHKPLEYGTEQVEAWHCAEGCPVAELDRQSGDKMHGAGAARDGGLATEAANSAFFGDRQGEANGMRYGDTGGASRFFFTAQTSDVDATMGPCDANTVGESLPPSSRPGASAPSGAATEGHPEDSTATDPNPSGVASTSATPNESSANAASDTPPTPSTAPKFSHGPDRPKPSPISSHVSYAGLGVPTVTTTTTPSRLKSDGYADAAISGDTLTSAGPGGLDSAARFRYVAKASRAERNAGLDGFEAKPAGVHDDDAYVWPKNGDGSERNKKVEPRANHHPTVKPIDLMRWLVRLVTPPGGCVLDPFVGSGTTGIAAILEGFSFIGIEREVEYCEIARARLAWWAEHPEGMELVKRLNAEAERKAIVDAGQLELL